MKKSRALGVLIGGLVLTSLAVAGCSSGGATAEPQESGGGDEQYVVGISNTLASSLWREQMICSIKAEALASGKVSEVITVSKDGGPTEQIQDLQNLISQGVDILVVNPSDPEKLNSIIAEAQAQGITVVVVDSTVTAPDTHMVTNDQVAVGELEMRGLAEMIGGEGDVLYMRGIQGVQADIDRDTGVKAALEDYPGINLKEVWMGWDYTKAGEVAVQEFTAKQYDGVWSSGADFPVVKGMETAGAEPVPVAGEGSNEFIKLLSEGAQGVIVTNPPAIGGAGLNVALRVLDGEDVPYSTVITPETFNTTDNAEEIADMYLPGQPPRFQTTLSVPGLTTYTDEQVLACKGPGE
ncbi:LacI family transcriptional regulator [Microbacterium sp. Leaf288]|uniref:substrate-binding domain-containing protein n=1 Tax=Microbacterium sp. Leaf288 TaxID=1736323 RepID=UPI0007004006|nr:substrate-binding domain-containing protein [Microbacterium sp. Leaf288]KQP67854.1 LacI family transcriptional regulator [Microbacterium sp. Leaf288]